jgi:simple sugar transport system permease protein
VVFLSFSVVTDKFLTMGGATTWLDDSATLGIWPSRAERSRSASA